MARRAARAARSRAKPRETTQQKRYRAYQARHPDWADDPNWKQRARGHKPREHVERKRREVERHGFTSYQRGQLRKFARQQGYRSQEDEDEIFEAMLAMVQQHGYGAFAEIREFINAKNREHLHRGKVITIRGRGMNRADMDELAAKYGIDVKWLYYR